MTAVSVLDELADACRKHKCRLVISALQRQPRIALHNTGFLRADRVMLARDTPMAIERAKALLSDPDKRCTGLTPIDECGASHGR